MMKLLMENGAEQFPYQDLWLKGDPRPPVPLLWSSSFETDYRPKLSHSQLNTVVYERDSVLNPRPLNKIIYMFCALIIRYTRS